MSLEIGPVLDPAHLATLRKFDDRAPSDRPPLHHVAFDPEWDGLRQWIEAEVATLRHDEQVQFVPRIRAAAHFLQSLHELATGALLRAAGCAVAYEVAIGGQRPDWLVTRPDGSKVIVEVVTRTNAHAKTRRRWVGLHERLADVPSSWAVFVHSNKLRAPDSGDAKWLVGQLRPWLQSPARRAGDMIRLGRFEFKIEPFALGWTALVVPSPESGFVDEGPVLRLVRAKASKYRACVEASDVPFVVVAGADLLTGLNESTLATALLGRPNLHFTFSLGTTGRSSSPEMSFTEPRRREIDELTPHLSALLWLSFPRDAGPRWSQFTIPHAARPVARGEFGPEIE